MSCLFSFLSLLNVDFLSEFKTYFTFLNRFVSGKFHCSRNLMIFNIVCCELCKVQLILFTSFLFVWKTWIFVHVNSDVAVNSTHFCFCGIVCNVERLCGSWNFSFAYLPSVILINKILSCGTFCLQPTDFLWFFLFKCFAYFIKYLHIFCAQT